jgi:hypothetical protein
VIFIKGESLTIIDAHGFFFIVWQSKVVYGMHVNTTWGGNKNPFVNDETISITCWNLLCLIPWGVLYIYSPIHVCFPTNSFIF